MRQLIYPIHRNAAHPALLRPRMIGKQSVTIGIPIWATSIWESRSKESDDWRMNRISNVQWASISRNMQSRLFFKSNKFNEICFTH